MSHVFEVPVDKIGNLEVGNVSLQTWVPSMPYYDEVVRRNNEGARWALVSLTDKDEDDGQGMIPVHLG
jgi:hypothetical protein